MKNYLDLRATDLKLDVCVELVPVGRPDIVVEIANNTYANSELNVPKKLKYQLDIKDTFSIEIELRNKTYTMEHETAVIIQHISIDSIDIVPKFDYLANYTNDHDNNNPTNYLGFNGKWVLNFDRPFYQWLHQVTGQGLLVDE